MKRHGLSHLTRQQRVEQAAKAGRAGHAKGTSRKWTPSEAAANASAGGRASAIARSVRKREWLSYGVGL